MKQKIVMSFFLFFIMFLFFSIQMCIASSSEARKQYINGVLSKFEESPPAETPAKKEKFLQKKHEFEINGEVSHITYKEPGVRGEKGLMKGVVLAYTFRGRLPIDVKNGTLRMESSYSWGQVDYDGVLVTDPSIPHSVKNVDDCILEFRVLVGNDFLISETTNLTPYIGFGYRYLSNNGSSDPAGYDREENYFYIPIGFDLVRSFQHGWLVGIKAEYDAFCAGWQESHLSDIHPGLGDYTQKQKRGYGIRGSLRFQKKSRIVDFILEPFIRYWNIQESEWVPLLWYGEPHPEVPGWAEPKNRTTELGCKLALVF